ncbi:MAG: bacteriohemerythrin [Pseudomonadota bacterium]
MEKITWSDKYCVGLPIIDEQHKRIVRMVNWMVDNQNTDTTSEVIADVLTDMTQYAREHFKTEEALLEENNYPELLAHKELHKKYRLKTVSFCKETMADSITIPEDITQFLLKWWGDHILGHDMKFKYFFQKLDMK